MKKLFLLTLGLVLGFSAFAQVRVSKDAKNIQITVQKPSDYRVIDGSAVQGMTFNMPQSVVSTSSRDEDDFTEYDAMVTNYDLQTNSALSGRVVAWPDGTAAFTATWDHSENINFPDRGTGYNYFDGEDIGEQPTERVEGTLKTGWPTIAAMGDGEILASHGGSPTATHVYKRATKGEGAWTEMATIENLQWPRIGVTGDNNQYVHIIGARQTGNSTIGYTNYVMWSRSTDGGETWSEATEIPYDLIDNASDGMYANRFGADDYTVATNGNTIAVLFGSYVTDLFYIISHDNGETWEKQIVAPWCEDNGDIHTHLWDSFPDGMPNHIIACDNTHSIAIDNNGVVHVAFGLLRWQQATGSTYSYYPFWNYGIVYWNSEYENEQGGHEIPLLGDWSGDTMFLEEFGDTLTYSLDIERLDTLCRIDGGEHLWYFGYPIEIDEETGDTCHYQSAYYIHKSWSYRNAGTVEFPGISVDNNGNIAVIYSVVSAKRYNESNGFYFRNAYVSYKPVGQPWHDDEINLTESFEHSVEEAYFTTAAQHAYDGVFYMLYNADEEQGLFLDIDDDYPNSNGGGLTENRLIAIRLTPSGIDGINENEINPMTTVRAYPNPATDVINLEINASMNSEMNVSIYTLTGQKVMDKTVKVGSGINTTAINVSELESGVYFCSVNANGFNRTVKFIVK